MPKIISGPKNTTAAVGQNLSFLCITDTDTDSAIRISWQRNGRSLHHSRQGQANVRMQDNGTVGTLYLDNIGEADDGLYQCIARNDLGVHFSSPARLLVESECH